MNMFLAFLFAEQTKFMLGAEKKVKYCYYYLGEVLQFTVALHQN